jgi:hypothetical protein
MDAFPLSLRSSSSRLTRRRSIRRGRSFWRRCVCLFPCFGRCQTLSRSCKDTFGIGPAPLLEPEADVSYLFAGQNLQGDLAFLSSTPIRLLMLFAANRTTSGRSTTEPANLSSFEAAGVGRPRNGGSTGRNEVCTFSLLCLPQLCHNGPQRREETEVVTLEHL